MALDTQLCVVYCWEWGGTKPPPTQDGRDTKMSRSSEQKKAKKAAQRKKKQEQIDAHFIPVGGSKFAKKATRKATNQNSPFFQGKSGE